MGKTAEDFLNVMRGWIGKSEANGEFKEIIDLYNSVKPLPRGYTVKYTDEWCDTTISAAAIKAGMTDLIGRECGCQRHIDIFKKLGIWNEDGAVTPKAGDIILYNWDTKMQPNDGWADHIGVVEKVINSRITVIEGNKSGAVARRTIAVGDGRIRGYARPKYDAAPAVNTTTYYSKYNGTSGYIDVVFKAIGVPDKYIGKWTNRLPIAAANGIINYTGRAKENTQLINLAKRGQLKKA